jgi:hypothetical protein
MERDRALIENAMARFCEHFDNGRLEAAAELFAPDVRYLGSFFTAADRDELLAFWKRNVILYENGTPQTAHMNTNIDISVDEDNGTAEARSYLVTFQALHDFALQATNVVRCVDRFTKSNGSWLWRERRVLPYLFGDTSRQAREHVAPGPWDPQSSPPQHQ